MPLLDRSRSEPFSTVSFEVASDGIMPVVLSWKLSFETEIDDALTGCPA
jgi:hypothetical protein